MEGSFSTIEIIRKMVTIQETKIWIVRVVGLKTYFGLSKKGKVAEPLNLGNCQLVPGMQILYAGNIS